MKVITLEDEEVEELRKLFLDEEESERRMRSARTAKDALLRKIAKVKPEESWRLSDDRKHIVVGNAGAWERG
jgi:hypothetical protein